MAALALSFPPLTASGTAIEPCEASMRGIGIPLDQKPTARVGGFGIFEFTTEVEFQPCARKARTAWAGGLILRDRAPVTLLVAVGEEPARPLRLGR